MTRATWGRGPLFVIAAALGFAWAFGEALVAPLVCAAKGRHVPERSHIGGMRCLRCDEPLSDLSEAGLMDGGAYVRPERYQ